MNDDLFTYKVGILGLSYPLYDEPQCDNLENYDLGVHEQNVCYDEVEKSYVEVVIFFNKRLVRLIDVIMEQWIDLKYGNHETMDKEIKDDVIATWLIRSYKQQFNDYVEIKRKRDVYEHDTDMEYDPSNVEFTEWLASKFYDEEVIIDSELSNPRDDTLIEENEIA
ncbi:hypothetical protein Tco_0103694 [Tanacetum coccineum]